MCLANVSFAVELGTFLCNSEMERHRLKVKSLTVSLW